MQPKTGKTEYTDEDFLKEEPGDGLPFQMVTCLNCGAFAIYTRDSNRVKHYSSCQPGEAKFWERHYAS